MHIRLEPYLPSTITHYTKTSLSIQGQSYAFPCIITHEHVMAWTTSDPLTLETLEPFCAMKPELILIGYATVRIALPLDLQSFLSQQRIGIEIMELGAACRTFNLLLPERNVILGLLP